MHKFYGKGQMGMGPMHGMCFGPCCFGWKKGAGRGLGKCCCWCCPQTKKDQLKALAEHRKAWGKMLEEIKKKEQELGKKK